MNKVRLITNGRQRSETASIYNSSSQLLSISARPPGGDFYSTEQQIHIGPGKSATLPRNHINEEQVKNLQAKGMLRVVYSS